MARIALVGRDIGAPALKGATAVVANTVSVTAGGADIWNGQDEFHFACAEVGGNFSLTARLEAMDMADPYTKAGIMLRAGPGAGAPHVMLFAFGDNRARNLNNGGVEFQSRAKLAEACTGVYPPQPLPEPPEFPANFPHLWLRLMRRENTFEALVSKDGAMWRRYCLHKMALPGSGLLGLAVTSHNRAKTVTARFRDVTFDVIE